MGRLREFGAVNSGQWLSRGTGPASLPSRSAMSMSAMQPTAAFRSSDSRAGRRPLGSTREFARRRRATAAAALPTLTSALRGTEGLGPGLVNKRLATTRLNRLRPMATLVRITCRTPSAGVDALTLEVLTTATAHQQHALALIQTIQP